MQKNCTVYDDVLKSYANLPKSRDTKKRIKPRQKKRKDMWP